MSAPYQRGDVVDDERLGRCVVLGRRGPTAGRWHYRIRRLDASLPNSEATVPTGRLQPVPLVVPAIGARVRVAGTTGTVIGHRDGGREIKVESYVVPAPGHAPNRLIKWIPTWTENPVEAG